MPQANIECSACGWRHTVPCGRDDCPHGIAAQFRGEQIGRSLVVCEHHIVPQDCPYCELKRLRAQRDKLMTACEFSFAFVDSVEWTDNTSETQAGNVKDVLQRAITAAEGR